MKVSPIPLKESPPFLSICPQFSDPISMGVVTHRRLQEISGLIASLHHPGIYWVHNDSGDEANVYSLTSKGRLLKSFRLQKVRARDFEDMAILKRKGRPDYLYVADIGDNGGQRKAGIRIHRFKEPKNPRPASGKKKARSALIKKVDTMRLDYPDFVQDSEALLVDPWTAQLLLISKPRMGWPRVYSVDGFAKKATLKLETVIDPERAGAFIHMVTAADISSDGHWIVLRTYTGVFLFYRTKGQSVAQALEGKACSLDAPEEMQGEAIAFQPAKKALPKAPKEAPPPSIITISEGSKANFYQMDPIESPAN